MRITTCMLIRTSNLWTFGRGCIEHLLQQPAPFQCPWVRLLPRPRVFEVGPIFRSEKSFTHRLQGSRWTWWYLLGFGHDSGLSVDRAEGSLLLCLLESDVSSTGPLNIIFHGPDMLWARSARHMTEFTGLDIEMTFKDHYHEAGCPFLSLLVALTS